MDQASMERVGLLIATRGGLHAVGNEGVGETPAPFVVTGVDPGAVQYNAPCLGEARMEVNKLGLFFGADPVAREPIDHELHAMVPRAPDPASASGWTDGLADDRDEFGVRACGPAAPRATLPMTVQARGRVEDRPQPVAAVASGVVGEPPSIEEGSPQGDDFPR